jgi:hypothetical protein
LPPHLCFLVRASVYALLNITVSIRISFSLCTELPLCFKEEFFGCAYSTGRYPPNIRYSSSSSTNQLTLISSGAFSFFQIITSILLPKIRFMEQSTFILHDLSVVRQLKNKLKTLFKTTLNKICIGELICSPMHKRKAYRMVFL